MYNVYICGGDGIIHCVSGQDCITRVRHDKRVVKPFASGRFVIRPLLFDLPK